MVRTTLKTISQKPFPQNYLEEVLERELGQNEVPPDFAAGLRPVLAECMANGVRAEKIVRLRYESGLTYTQIAKEIGVEQERIRYIIRDSQRRLRRPRYRSFLKGGYAAWQSKTGGKRAGPPNV
ncbi:sigma factor-like helix-turn-helix DNA-binding protein [Allofournierella sp.]|uniref:sigma factor-like helix-turn-helix DNA-binding protein n=1 Tax=Allofournierella sp. TaxID=1940256 RepID=UPI003AB699C1